MTRRYTNPPVSRLGFIFLYEEISDWKNRAADFKILTENDLPESYFFLDNNTKIEDTSKNAEKYKDKVKAFLFRNKVFQFGVDNSSIFCNGLRGFDSFPTYQGVQDSLGKFFPLFWGSDERPLKAVVITYTDNIYLPWPRNEDVDIAPYFTCPVFAPGLLDSRLKSCFCQYDLEPPVCKDQFGVRYCLSSLPQKELVRFQLSWDYTILPENQTTMTIQAAHVQMENAHIYMRTCFEKIITDKCRELFDKPFANHEEEK